MTSLAHLNPASWHNDNHQRRITVDCQPSSGVGAALRTHFPVAPVSAELQKMLDALR